MKTAYILKQLARWNFPSLLSLTLPLTEKYQWKLCFKNLLIGQKDPILLNENTLLDDILIWLIQN